MTRYVTSVDGTRIAFDRLGQGPPVIVVSGIFCDRTTTQPLAEQLAQGFSVLNYDRRGRGESTDTAPYAVAREVEDLAALIVEAGGAASVYGHSSGAGLALNAAASGLPIPRLVLHEPPYGPADHESTRRARELAENVRRAISEDRRADAIELFLAAAGMPPEMVEGMSGDPKMLAVAPTTGATTSAGAPWSWPSSTVSVPFGRSAAIRAAVSRKKSGLASPAITSVGMVTARTRSSGIAPPGRSRP